MKNEKKYSQKSSKIPIVFFGSGPVAAESLRLLSESFHIEAVVTKATTEREMRAVYRGDDIYFVSDRKSLDHLFTTKKFESKLAILIDFGIIVSNKIINYFEHGIINSHFSLLPQLRGADPISFAILEGKQQTGVSLMMLVEAMDEGPILGYGELELDGNETTPSLTDDLVNLSYTLLSEIVPAYLDGEIIAAEQVGDSTYTRKLNKADGQVDWTKPALQTEREIRAFAGWPKSSTMFGEVECVITKSSVLDQNGQAGELFIYEKVLAVYCGKQALLIESLKPAGKKEMDSTAFLAGYKQRIGL